MPTLTVALNQNESDNVITNGWWTTNLPQLQNLPICQVTTRLMAIDSKKVDDNTIIIPEDISPTMLVSYYDMDYDNTNKEQLGGGAWNAGDSTFDMYSGYAAENYGTFQSAQIYIKNGYLPQTVGGTTCAGTFLVGKDYKKAPNAAVAFVATIQYIDENGEYQTKDVTGSNVEYGIIPGAVGGAAGIPMYYSTGNNFTVRPVDGQSFRYISNTISILQVSGQYPGNDTYGASNGNRSIGGSIPPTGPVTVANSVGRSLNILSFGLENITPGGATPTAVNLVKRIVPLQFKQGTYDPNSFAVMITQQTDRANGIYPPPDNGATDQLLAPLNILYANTTEFGAGLRLRRLDFPDAVTNVTFAAGDTYLYNTATYIGAQHVTMLYNNAFAFSQLHTALRGNNTIGDKVALFEYNDALGGKRYNYMTKACGVLIHDLQPADWWQNTLGIYDQVVIPLRTDSAGVHYVSQTDVLGKTTGGFDTRDIFGRISGTAGYEIETFRNPPTTFPVYSDVTGQTSAIFGDTIVANPTGGLYVVEIQGLPPKDSTYYVNANEVNPNISCIVSTRYDTNDQITGDSTNGINYTSNAPCTQKTYTVRIKDQNTGEVPILGPNNSIILDFTW